MFDQLNTLFENENASQSSFKYNRHAYLLTGCMCNPFALCV